MSQLNIINKFCAFCNYSMIKFPSKDEEEYGKIIAEEELLKLNLSEHEIHRSISYQNYNTLFVYTVNEFQDSLYIDNSLQLLIKSIENAKAIERVYPNIFRWAFDGIYIKAYAIVPSGDISQSPTVSRYGGTEMFIKILKQHLKNIEKMYHGFSKDYTFLNHNYKLNDSEISLGSKNIFNDMYSVGITLDMSYIDIIRSSKNNIQDWKDLNVLDMKYWAREVNPDFLVETKHVKIDDTIELDMEFKLYPQCIKNVMNLEHKGNLNRFLLTRFLLAVHEPKDAKFVYDMVLSDEELEHTKTGNCSTQWNYIRNNIKRYSCPTCSQLCKFCDKACKLDHPLQDIQISIEKKGDDLKCE